MKQINLLEDSLEVQIFYRTPRGEAGLAVGPRAVPGGASAIEMEALS